MKPFVTHKVERMTNRYVVVVCHSWTGFDSTYKDSEVTCKNCLRLMKVKKKVLTGNR